MILKTKDRTYKRLVISKEEILMYKGRAGLRPAYKL